MRKTKIICTIGPASEHEDVLTRMIKAGMDVARLNFSHGSHEEHQGKIDLIKKVRQKLHLPIAIMLDTKGPEYRIKTFENGKIELKDGDTFTLTTDDIVGNQERVSVNYENLIKDLKVGDRVLVANGIIILQVRELKGNNAICDVIAGGTLSDRKSMNFPNKVMKHAYLSEQDKDDLLFGIKNEVDYVAASFVSTKQDVADLRSFLDENGGEDIDIIAKIENRSGVDHVEEICEIANGIMIARGDLGVEIPGVEVPARAELAAAIEETKFNNPICPVYQNVSTKGETDQDVIKANLIAQLTAPVRWTQSVQNMIADGATHFIELGPGSVLQGLIKKIDKTATTEGRQ